MHKVNVRHVDRSAHEIWIEGFLYATKKSSLFKYWNSYYKKLSVKELKQRRKSHLEELSHIHMWFTNAYNSASPDIEISVFTYHYDIYITHYLVCENHLTRLGEKKYTKFIQLLPKLNDVDYLWDRTKAIVEKYNISWLIFDNSTILIKN